LNVLAVWVVTLISGYTIIALIVEPRTTEVSFLRKVIFNFKTATNFVLRLLIGKRISTEPTWLSSKLAFCVLVLSGFFILSLYRAILVAFVAVEIDHPPVESFNELIKSNYLLAVKKDTAPGNVFVKAKHGTMEYQIQNSNKISWFSEDVDIYLDKMVNNTNGSSPIIVFHDEGVIQFSEHYPCSLLQIRNKYQGNKQSSGMIFKKNWPYTSLFNYYFLVMKEKGLMDKLYQPYLMTTKQFCSDQQRIRHHISKPKPVGINTTVSCYLIVFVGCISAIIVLLLEIRYS
jgi:hypothetical protein